MVVSFVVMKLHVVVFGWWYVSIILLQGVDIFYRAMNRTVEIQLKLLACFDYQTQTFRAIFA